MNDSFNSRPLTGHPNGELRQLLYNVHEDSSPTPASRNAMQNPAKSDYRRADSAPRSGQVTVVYPVKIRPSVDRSDPPPSLETEAPRFRWAFLDHVRQYRGRLANMNLYRLLI